MITYLPKIATGLEMMTAEEILAQIANLYAPQSGGGLVRPYESVTALNSAARTVTTNSADILVPVWASGVVAVMNCTAAGAAGSIKPRIQGKFPATISWFLADDTVGLAAATGSRALVAWRFGATSFANITANTPLPPTIFFTVTHATGDSYTYSLVYTFLS